MIMSDHVLYIDRILNVDVECNVESDFNNQQWIFKYFIKRNFILRYITI